MINSNTHLYWYIARGSGVVAYLLLTASVCLGIALSRRWHSPRIPRLIVDEAHRWLVIVFYLFTAVHIASIFLDPYIGFSVPDLFIPFLSPYRRLWMALGIIGAELSVAVGASVWVRKRIGYRAWHALHALSYPIFFASLLHGLGTGTDTRTSWGMLLYAGSAMAVLAALAWRMADLAVWRKPVLATAFGATVLVLIWAITGPLAAN